VLLNSYLLCIIPHPSLLDFSMQQQAGLNKQYGLPTVLLAYTMWGILPLYWKMLDAVPSYEIICHRILWSFLFSLALLGLRRKISPFIKNLRDKRTVITFLATASLLGCNWLVYIWSVNNGYIIESSLGYFINPLIAVFFGVVFLREPLRPGQWAALSVALAGVLYLTFSYGRFPWIGLTLAVTFACSTSCGWNILDRNKPECKCLEWRSLPGNRTHGDV